LFHILFISTDHKQIQSTIYTQLRDSKQLYKSKVVIKCELRRMYDENGEGKDKCDSVGNVHTYHHQCISLSSVQRAGSISIIGGAFLWGKMQGLAFSSLILILEVDILNKV